MPLKAPGGGMKAQILSVSLPPAAEGAATKQEYYVQSTD